MMFSRGCLSIMGVFAVAAAACVDPPQSGGVEHPIRIVQRKPTTEAAREVKSAPSTTAPAAVPGCPGVTIEARRAEPSKPRDSATAEREVARANDLARAGNYPRALEAYDRAIAADGDHGLALLGKAEAHLYTDGDQAKMRDSLTRAMTLLPTNPRVHLRMAAVLAESGDRDRASAHYRCALQLRPADTEARRAFARHLYQSNKLDEAEVELVRTVNEAPDDTEASILLADVLENEKKFAEAAKRVETTADRVKTSAPLYRRAAELYEAAGDAASEKRTRAAADKIDPPKKERDLRELRPARGRKK